MLEPATGRIAGGQGKTSMHEVRTFAPGVSATSVALSNAAGIRGIQVDNPSGSWLYVVSEQVYIPPYTIGWGLPLSYSQTSITINAVNGPAGQISTSAGDPWTLTLFDEEVDQSAGAQYQFTTGFASTIALVGFSLNLLSSNTYTQTNVQLIAPVAGKRIRLHSLFFDRTVNSAGWRPPVTFIFSSDLGSIIFPLNSGLQIYSHETWKSFQFRPGQADLKTGANFRLFFAGVFEMAVGIIPAMQIDIMAEYEYI